MNTEKGYAVDSNTVKCHIIFLFMNSSAWYNLYKRHRELPDGRMDIDGDRVYAIVQSYASRMERDNPTFEAHRRYIDIQYVASGTEILGWAPLDSVTITVPYDEEKDALLGTVPANEWTPVRFTEGQVIVLYPTDAHAPGLAVGHPADIKKVVIKIALGS